MISYQEYLRDTALDKTSQYTDALVASTELAATVRREIDIMFRHRDNSGVSERLMNCMRAYKGEYSPQQLSEISTFGGSKAYARITGVKSRTLAALLEDLYTGPEPPWRVDPTPEPSLPVSIEDGIKGLVNLEVQQMQAMGEQVTPEAIEKRLQDVYDLALKAAKKQAEREAEKSTNRLRDMLQEGGFTSALKEFLTYFAQFPYAVLKGPFFRMTRSIKYIDRVPTVVETPTQCYSSPNPMDIWFSPGVSRADDGAVVERIRMSKVDLEALRGVPGYDIDAIDGVIFTYPNGHTEWTTSIEQSRADAEERESPLMNDTGLYDVLEYHGYVSGATLQAEPLFQGTPVNTDRAHACVIRIIDNVVIGAQLSPDPMERSIYRVSSFQKVPGSVVGFGLPEVLADVQNLANATLRSLINNMAMASGPQVGINTASIAESENAADMYPWKRWVFTPDPAAPSGQPLMFFQPTDNSQNLLAVFERAMQYADEVSAIPRYASGSDRVGGAASTASGLAMLQGNVAKVVKHVAANIDEDVLSPVLQMNYDMTLLTDQTGIFRGDEKVVAMGAVAAAKADADKMRALEMLQITANPIDMQIIGPDGRAMLLAEVAEHLGFDYGRLQQLLEARIAQFSAMGQDPTNPNQPPPGPPGAPGADNNPQGQPQAPGGPGEGPGAAVQGAATTRPPSQIAG